MVIFILHLITLVIKYVLKSLNFHCNITQPYRLVGEGRLAATSLQLFHYLYLIVTFFSNNKSHIQYLLNYKI